MPAKEMGMQGIVVKLWCTMVKNPDASGVEIENFCSCTVLVCCLARSHDSNIRNRKNCSYMLDHLVSMATLSLTS